MREIVHIRIATTRTSIRRASLQSAATLSTEMATACYLIPSARDSLFERRLKLTRLIDHDEMARRLDQDNISVACVRDPR
jgi:hypothetical protein